MHRSGCPNPAGGELNVTRGCRDSASRRGGGPVARPGLPHLRRLGPSFRGRRPRAGSPALPYLPSDVPPPGAAAFVLHSLTSRPSGCIRHWGSLPNYQQLWRLVRSPPRRQWGKPGQGSVPGGLWSGEGGVPGGAGG